jgi:hypothetical protein
VAVIVLLIGPGCASYNAARPPALSYDLHTQDQKVSVDGVVLMAKPVHQQAELERYFDDDLLKYGILPVQINLYNNRQDGTLTFSTDGVNLVSAANERSPVLSIDQMIDKAKRSYWRTAGWGLAFGLVGATVSAINVSNTNKKLRADYESRILQSGTLRPGSTTEGFVFFPVPPDISSLNGWKISLVLKEASTSNDVILTYGLAGTMVPALSRRMKEIC